jgi:hypothetical protein|uniref:Uncharacterized protein n=1 Tax=Zea mays TaxID=4577 RepID=A0A804QER7_MAIZE
MFEEQNFAGRLYALALPACGRFTTGSWLRRRTPRRSAPPRRHGDQLATLLVEAERAASKRQSAPPRFSTRNPISAIRLSRASAYDTANVLACTGTNPADASTVRHGSNSGLSTAAAARWRDTKRRSTSG